MCQLETFAFHTVISDDTRSRILTRSAAAATRDELVNGIFAELRSAGVDPYEISLEEFKTVLFEAICAAKRNH